MYITDPHDMTLAVKVALKPSTINQSISQIYSMFLIYFFSLFLQLIGNIGTVDFNGTVCDPEMLKKYLLFPKEVDIDQISQSLCGINDSLISNITNDLVRMLDIPNIIRLVCIQYHFSSHCFFFFQNSPPSV